ncbi:hypothetical protein [Mucilaginibacter sp.]|uniref:NHL domain-containing protein n=1 Tax=Mucilaginibacter sp. TaxID=1882438 RepID=UPI00284EFA62|nr:hypothetical protein [Mucilaginibacter sp.]MDR3694791.1 hypothetical protein [Mucilaginibacter sp.]
MSNVRSKYIFLISLLLILTACSKKGVSPNSGDSTKNNKPTKRDTTLTAMVSTIAGVNNYQPSTLSEPNSTVVDVAGNVYVADYFNSVIMKIDASGVMTTLAGSGKNGYADGIGTNAQFYYPSSIVFDTNGDLIVADRVNFRIRRVTMAGVVTTIAGSGTEAHIDGTGSAASFDYVSGIAIDKKGYIYVSDGWMIRKIDPTGVVTSIAGSSQPGYADGKGSSARFINMAGLAVDAQDNIYVAERLNSRIRKITPDGTVSTFAGTSTLGFVNGPGKSAEFGYPTDIVTDANGNLFVDDQGNNVIRKITANGVVSTFAGSGVSGQADGNLTTATFDFPMGICLDGNGNFYLGNEYDVNSTTYSVTIRKISVNGLVSTFFGGNSIVNGAGTQATFNHPTGLALDGSGNLFVADAQNNVVRKITSDGVVSTFAGNGALGAVDGSPQNASFNNPTGISVDAAGNVYVADFGNNQLRIITPGGHVSSISLIVTDNGASGPLNNPTGVAVVPNGKIIYYTNTQWNSICRIEAGITSTFSVGNNSGLTNGMFFSFPYALTTTADGTVYVADTHNHRICKINATGTEYLVAGSATAGNSPQSGNSDGAGTVASFNKPAGIAVDAQGNLYIADSGNNLIRRITQGGVVTTIAGSGALGITDGKGQAASFNNPTGIAVNAAGNTIYVADAGSSLIRKITLTQIIN